MGDDELEFQKWKAGKQSVPPVSPAGDDAEFAAWQALQKPKMPTKLAIAKRNASTPHPEDLEAPEPSYATKALGGVASMARDIPGAEALQAMGGMRGLDLTKSGDRAQFGDAYKESLGDIRAAEGAAPRWVRRYNRVAGGIVAGAVAPGSVMRQGALTGFARGALQADPSNLKERIDSGGKQGAIDALAARVAQIGGNAGRTIASRTLNRVAQLRRGAIEAADKVNYGKAAAEGSLAAANPTPTVVSNAMNETDIKPYNDIVKNSRSLKGADDATLLREAYKLMSERQGTLANRVVNASDFKAGSQLEKADIGAGKKVLLNAADKIMPSMRPAVYQHAELMRQMQAFRAGADVTNRVVRGTSGAARNLEKNSPDAFMQSIESMSHDEAKAALQGVLGRLKDRTSITANPFKGFGIPKSGSRLNQMVPYIEALDRQAGNKTSSVLGLLGIGVAGPAGQ